jgi:hypothetical protein
MAPVDALGGMSGASAGSGAFAGSAGGASGVGGGFSGAAGATGGSASGGAPAALGAKPYMGWSSWSSMSVGVNAAKVKAAADAVAKQLLPYGYEYINVDDGWYSGFDENGRFKPDNAKFPDGIRAVADYVHGLGLKFGIYLMPGLNDAVYNANSPILGTSYHAKDIVSNPSLRGSTNTKTGTTAKKIDFTRPGASEYVQSAADLLAAWGVDFIKMDFVGPGGGGGNADNRDDIAAWRKALNKTGRSIWLELSNQLSIDYASAWQQNSNGWRIGNDIECYCTTLTNWAHVIRNIGAAAAWTRYAGPGGWNDLDSLEVGNGSKDGLTLDERYTYYTFWAINAAPLYLGSDPTQLDATDLAILTNRAVIAVDQAGIAASRVSVVGNQQVWAAKQADSSFTVALFNFDATASKVTAKFSDFGAPSSLTARDLWSQTELGRVDTAFSATLPAHGSRLIELRP